MDTLWIYTMPDVYMVVNYAMPCFAMLHDILWYTTSYTMDIWNHAKIYLYLGLYFWYKMFYHYLIYWGYTGDIRTIADNGVRIFAKFSMMFFFIVSNGFQWTNELTIVRIQWRYPWLITWCLGWCLDVNCVCGSCMWNYQVKGRTFQVGELL